MVNETSSWYSEQESCSHLSQEIMSLIQERNQTAKDTSSFNKITSQIWSKFKQFTSKIHSLQESLTRSSSTYQITQRESEWRQKLLDKLLTQQRQLTSSIDSTSASLPRRSSPYDPYSRDNFEDSDLTYEGFQQQKTRIIEEQDQGLDSLAKVISRQKQMAIDIGNEVDGQNELLDDIVDHTGATDSKIRSETRHIKVVERKSASCWYWVVIVLLFIAIICVVAIPYTGKP